MLEKEIAKPSACRDLAGTETATIADVLQPPKAVKRVKSAAANTPEWP